MVMIQAVRMREATVQFTADNLLESPTPRMAEVITCVVEVGSPMAEAPRMTPADAVSTQNPCTGCSLTKSCPTVLMILQPPAAVPKAMAMAQETLTQVGTSKVARVP